MALAPAFETPTANSNHGASIAAGTGTLIAANPERNGLSVQIDPGTAATTPNLYLRFGTTGTPSATNFDVCVTPTLPWDGMVGITVYRGALRYTWAGSVAAGIAVTET